MTCTWINKSAVTPPGKTRTVKQCSVCGRVKFKHYGLTRFVEPNGSVSESATVEEPWCPGKPRQS
jgi:hypothetical protein